MVRARAALVLGLVGLCWSSLSRAEVLWNGTFTSGNTSAWTRAQQVNPDRLVVTQDPLGQRGNVLRVTVNQGDSPVPGASGNRAELAYEGDMPQNAERYYHWATMWPTSFVSANTWQLFTQFHQVSGGGSPPVQFFTEGDQIILQIDSVQKWAVPLQQGQWHDFVFHVFWSSDPTKGYVELWYDGGHVLDRTPCATLFPGQPAYLKEGLYRNLTIAQQQILYQQGAIIGTTLDDVWPEAKTGVPAAPSPASDGGTTASSTGSSSTPPPPMTPEQVADFRQKAGCSAAGPVAWPVLALAFGLLIVRVRRRLAVARATPRTNGHS